MVHKHALHIQKSNLKKSLLGCAHSDGQMGGSFIIEYLCIIQFILLLVVLSCIQGYLLTQSPSMLL